MKSMREDLKAVERLRKTVSVADRYRSCKKFLVLYEYTDL
jgi:hypothetical protein